MTLTQDEIETVQSALAHWAATHRAEAESSPFSKTVEYSRSEWLKAHDLMHKIQTVHEEQGGTDVEI